VPGQPLCSGQRSEENDGIPAQLDIVLERRLLRIGQGCDEGIELQRLKRAQVDGEDFVWHGPIILKKDSI
jgi:hypothetical protein